MKRPLTWAHWLLVVCVTVVAVEYALITWLAPRSVRDALRRLSGGTLTVETAQLVFPATVALTGLRSTLNTSEVALSAREMALRPRWIGLISRTLAFDTVDVHGPFARITRSDAGTVRWPELPVGRAPEASDAPEARSARGWRLTAKSVRVTDGTVELVDLGAAQAFHGVLQHVSVVAGPIGRSPEPSHVTFALRGELVGHGGHAAPFYCSGWFEAAARDLQASCRVEPLNLAAFGPYQAKGRENPDSARATIHATSQWTSRDNHLEARIQLAVAQLAGAKGAAEGTPLTDAAEVAPGSLKQLTGEVKIYGLLDEPSQWRSEFIPGDPQVQEIVRPLLRRGIEEIKIPIGKQTVGIGITPATPEAMEEIQAASQEVEQALEILAVPKPEEAAPVPQAAEPPTAPPPVEPAATSPPTEPAPAPEAPVRPPGSPASAPSP